jgi:hypothetical protein
MMVGNAETDIVLDMWNSPHLGLCIWHFNKDTWRWELVQELQSPMGDVNLDVVYGPRKHKQLRSWEADLQTWLK